MTEQEFACWKAEQQRAIEECRARWLRTSHRLLAVLGAQVVRDCHAAMRIVSAGRGSGRKRGEDGYPCAGDPDVVRMQRRHGLPAGSRAVQ